MNEFFGLLFVALAIYLSECFCWAPDAACAFSGRAGRGRLNDPLFALPALRKLLYVAHAMPARSGIALCERLPPPLTPTGVEDTAFVFDGATVMKDGKVVFRAATPVYAQRLARLLEEMRPVTHSLRETRIAEEFDRLLSVSRAKQRHNHYARIERFLKIECYALFASIFGLIPLTIYFRGLLTAIPLFLAALVVMIRILWIFNRAHRILYRGRNADRRAQVLQMVLMPLGTIRAHDRLQRELFGDFHFLAVARAILPQEQARDAAEAVIRDLEFAPVADDEAGSAWWRRAWRDAVWRHVRREYGEPDILLRTPEKKVSGAASFCPRCREEYLISTGLCQDCGGVPLREF